MRMWHRLAITIGATTVGSLLVFGLVFTTSAVNTLRDELDRRAQAGAQLVARQVEGVIRNIEFAGNTIAVVANDSIEEIAAAGRIDLDARLGLQNQLSFVLSVFPAAAQAWLVFEPDGIVGVGRNTGSSTAVRHFAEEVLVDTEPMGPSALYGDRDGQIDDSRLLIGKRVIDLTTGEPLAALVLAADDASFAGAIAQPEGQLGTRFRIVDSVGTLIGPADPPEDATDYSEFEASIDGVPWRAVSSVPLRAIRAYSLRVIVISLALLGLVSVAAILVSLRLARTFTRPLEALESQMREMDVERGGGELHVPGSWEIQHVAEGANRLLHRVRNLVDRVASEERTRQRFHFELLQAQIKPHFLYNALEMIHMLGETGYWRRAQRALRSLSEFYRMSLSEGRELISLEQEVALTESYLFVQHLRYADQFSYEIDVQLSNAAEILVPKLTIQPLVENAIYHGVKGAGRPCRIRVTAARHHRSPSDGAVDGWKLSVSDDGRGMDQRALNELRSAGGGSGFGFQSVVERLRLHVAEPVTVDVHSERDVGTTVTISIGGNSSVNDAVSQQRR